MSRTISAFTSVEQRLVRAFEQVRSNHPDPPDIHGECTLFAASSKEAAVALERLKPRCGEQSEGQPKRLDKRRSSSFNLVRDLHDLWLRDNESVILISILLQAAQALRDHEFELVLIGIEEKNARQRSWLMSRLKQAAPRALVVPI